MTIHLCKVYHRFSQETVLRCHHTQMLGIGSQAWSRHITTAPVHMWWGLQTMNTGVTGSISVMYPHQPTLVDPLESQLPSCSHVSPDVNNDPALVPQWDTSVEKGYKSTSPSMQASESWNSPTVFASWHVAQKCQVHHQEWQGRDPSPTSRSLKKQKNFKKQ